jgi:hypothetical protein
LEGYERPIEIKKSEMAYLEAHGYFASCLESIFYSIKHNLVPEVKVVRNPNLQDEEDSAADVVYDSNYELLLEKLLTIKVVPLIM